MSTPKVYDLLMDSKKFPNALVTTTVGFLRVAENGAVTVVLTRAVEAGIPLYVKDFSVKAEE